MLVGHERIFSTAVFSVGFVTVLHTTPHHVLEDMALYCMVVWRNVIGSLLCIVVVRCLHRYTRE